MMVSVTRVWPYLSIRPLDDRSLRCSSLTMGVSRGSYTLNLALLSQRACVVVQQPDVQPCLAVEVNSSSGLLRFLLVLQLVGLHLRLVPHRLCPALNVVVISIVLIFKLLRLRILGVKSCGTDGSLELVVDLWGSMLTGKLMMVESAVCPGAGLRGGQLRRSRLA